ncbi:MAG: hypothetical protein AB7O28_27665, partial [Vicinamibacterales bacterium]
SAPTNRVYTNPDGLDHSDFNTFEVALNRRFSGKWMLLTSAAVWNLKVTGSYDAPWGIRVTPVVRHQSGVNYARELTITAPAGLIATSGGTGGNRAYADSASDNREDNIWVFDIRGEKTVGLAGRMRLRLFLDLFNMTNSHASETISRATGLGYQKPSAILAPRTARLGFRFVW